MKGLELSERYFYEYGLPMLREQFPELLPRISAGLLGSGSECFGYDDEVSRDHDFEPGFALFLPSEEEVDRRSAFLLERAYQNLPGSFEGFQRSKMGPVGGSRHGVLRLSEFLLEKLGTPFGELDAGAWLRLTDQNLLETVNGRLFYDGDGRFSLLREELSYYPEDIQKKRLAGQLFLLGQSGGYNYERCLRHGEPEGAQLCIQEFVQAAVYSVFLLSERYMPYYKWRFRALRELPLCRTGGSFKSFPDRLYEMITTGNTPETAQKKQTLMKEITERLLKELLEQEFIAKEQSSDIGRAAYGVNDRIGDPVLRNLHILSGT